MTHTVAAGFRLLRTVAVAENSGRARTFSPACALPAPWEQQMASQNRWSQHVTETSDALSLEPDVFTLDDPRKSRPR
jgi:hypothetical protein